MNREIKFRVWTGIGMEYNVMAGVFGHFYVNPGDKRDGLDLKDSACLTNGNTKYSKETPLMEFTGLKDKNGREIYEGDIIKYRTNKNTEVVFNHEALFAIKFPQKDGYDIYIPLCQLSPQSREIIGNIFENPDLLNL